jgi:hypothetical protein
MPRLGSCAALTCASLIFAAGMGSAASAGEECSQHYKICNWSCDRTTNAVDNFLVNGIFCKVGVKSGTELAAVLVKRLRSA